MKKILMIAATALALTTGAAAFTTTPAEAGSKFSIHIGGGYGHGGYGHGHYGGHYYDGGCHYKWKKVRRKVWHHGHYHWKRVWRKVRICY